MKDKKIINFKYKNINKVNMASENTKKSKVIEETKQKLNEIKAIKNKEYNKTLSKFKFQLIRLKESIQTHVLNVIKLILNIEIDYIFVFAATYMFNFTYPWYWRLIGSIGIYYCFKIITQSIQNMLVINKR